MELLFFAVGGLMIYWVISYFRTKKKYERAIQYSLKEIRRLYSDLKTDNEQKKMSFFVLASKFSCMPHEVHGLYNNQLTRMQFNHSELIEAENAWRAKKFEEARILNISPENTPAALLESWTMEYQNKLF